MNLKINPRSETPIYQQIVQAIKKQLAAGELKAGSQLPTIRALAKQLHVHVNTVARAYTSLDQAGVISMQQGRGTFITEWIDHAKMREERHAELHRLIGYTVVEALSLGYSHEEIEGAFAESVNHWRREHHKNTARKNK
jgi:GntR family transcriptional regulator